MKYVKTILGSMIFMYGFHVGFELVLKAGAKTRNDYIDHVLAMGSNVARTVAWHRDFPIESLDLVAQKYKQEVIEQAASEGL